VPLPLQKYNTMPRSRSALVDRVVDSTELSLLAPLAFEIATTFTDVSIHSQNLLWNAESEPVYQQIHAWGSFVPAHVYKWTSVCEQIRANWNRKNEDKTDNEKTNQTNQKKRARLDSRFIRAERRYAKLSEDSFRKWVVDVDTL